MHSENKKVTIDVSTVSCEGEAPSIGHPKVYLEFGSKKQIVCPYCSKVFIRNNSGK